MCWQRKPSTLGTRKYLLVAARYAQIRDEGERIVVGWEGEEEETWIKGRFSHGKRHWQPNGTPNSAAAHNSGGLGVGRMFSWRVHGDGKTEEKLFLKESNWQPIGGWEVYCRVFIRDEFKKWGERGMAA
jgi:hypothetical protein